MQIIESSVFNYKPTCRLIETLLYMSLKMAPVIVMTQMHSIICLYHYPTQYSRLINDYYDGRSLGKTLVMV